MQYEGLGFFALGSNNFIVVCFVETTVSTFFNQIARQYMLEKMETHGRRIRIFRNGDLYYPGKKMLISPTYHRNFEQVLSLLTFVPSRI